jgi:hypothetical protein
MSTAPRRQGWCKDSYVLCYLVVSYIYNICQTVLILDDGGKNRAHLPDGLNFNLYRKNWHSTARWMQY